MENKKGTKRQFFNLFNILTVLVIIAGLAAALYFFVLREEPETTVVQSDIEYIIEIKDVRDEFTDKIEVGDTVTDSVGQIQIGTVKEIEYIRSHTYELDNDTGTLVASEHPDHSDFIITVSAKATLTDMGYDIGGCVINVGTPVYARFPSFIETGHCISVRIVNG